jgi:uncharacterized protein YndB with AHSA1/START domain
MAPTGGVSPVERMVHDHGDFTLEATMGGHSPWNLFPTKEGFTMTGPDGTVFPNTVVYKEITPVERMVHDHGDWENYTLFEATITFIETDGGTLITLRNLFPTKEARDMVVEKYGAIEGGHQTLARLDEYLSQRS